MRSPWLPRLGALGLALSVSLTAHADDFPPDPDRDRDGLSDFQEIHKYKTNPEKADSDGDGRPDGDWNERREYTYSIRTVLRVLPPVREDTLNDDYQDALILQREDSFVELEVVHYPLNTCAEAIVGDSNWPRVPKSLRPYLEPGPTTNWDAAMRRDLRRDLEKDGIDLDELDDLNAVKKVSSWALQRARSLQTFTTYLIHCPDGEPSIYPGLEDKFERKKYRKEWTVKDQFDHEVLGKGMYYQCTRGSCTSSAVYLSTVLRAAGIPTRMLLTVPCVDASSPDELRMAERGLGHHEVRETVMAGLRPLENAFAAHTFNEVWVGGRWRRLNYDNLGQNILGRSCFGLLTQVNIFHDLADADLAPTWGLGSLQGWNSPAFLNINPYSARSLDDRFGAHARIPNPPARSREHAHAEIIHAYWHDSDADRPDYVGRDAVEEDGSGHVFMEARHWIEDEGIAQYRVFWQTVDKEFVLKAEGCPDLNAAAQRGHWRNHFYIQIPVDQLERMVAGAEYRIVPRNRNSDHQWRIGEDVRIVGRGSAGRTEKPTTPPPPERPEGFEGHHQHATIVKAFWFDSPGRPEAVPADAFPADEAGHLMLEARDWVEGEGAGQYARFWSGVDREFTLKARGKKTLKAEARRGYWRSVFYVHVPPEQFEKMAIGVAYEIVPRNKNKDHQWKFARPATITRPDPDAEHRSLTLGRLREFQDPSIPDWIRETDLPQDGSRHLLAEIAEWIQGQDGDQIKLFTERADLEVSFVARGEKAVKGLIRVGCMTTADGDVRLVWVLLDPAEARKIEPGVEYELKPRNRGSRYRWNTSEAARFTWE